MADNSKYNQMAKSVRNSFGAVDENPPPPAPPAAYTGEEDPSQMTFAQRVTAQLKKLRAKGAPAPAAAAPSSGEGNNQAGTWIGNPAKPPKGTV